MATPHDALFKSTFGEVAIARSEIALLLPVEVTKKLDLNSLRIFPGSFLDEELRSSHTDILYELDSAGQKKPISLVYVILEHQSTPDHGMAFRLLRYMVRIWERWQAEHGIYDELPSIFPLVLYNGTSVWRTSRQFDAMFRGDKAFLDSAKPYRPSFEFVLDDLGAITASDVANRKLDPLTQLSLLALWTRSWRRRGQSAALLRAIFESLENNELSHRSVRNVLVYLYKIAPPKMNRRALQANLRGCPTEKRDFLGVIKRLA